MNKQKNIDCAQLRLHEKNFTKVFCDILVYCGHSRINFKDRLLSSTDSICSFLASKASILYTNPNKLSILQTLDELLQES